MFETLLINIKNEIAKVLMLVEVKSEDQAKKIDEKNKNEINQASSSANDLSVKEEPQRKIGRNEFCPCGSGKKYKHCHGVLK